MTAANPHGVSLANTRPGTLEELNAAVTDATLDGAGSPRPGIGDYVEVAGLNLGSTGPLEDMAGLTFELALPTGGSIVASMTVGCSTTGGSPAAGAWAISIDGVDGTEMPRSMSGVNDEGSLCVQAEATLGVGNYIVKGRWRRTSGASSVNANVAQLKAVCIVAPPAVMP